MYQTKKIRNRFILLAIIWSGLIGSNVKAQTITRYLTDFGAVGDSITDNTDAFIKAGIFFSNFLTNDTTGILIIPSWHDSINNIPAIYKVGRQLVYQEHFNDTVVYNGDTAIRIFNHAGATQAAIIGVGDTFNNYGMLQLSNVHGMVIKGSDSSHPPTIKYKDSLLYGSFLKPDSSFTSGAFTQTNLTASLQPLIFYGYNQTQQTKGWIGHFIEIKKCSRITIKDLRIDGNNTAFKWGGTYSADGGIQLPNAGICIKETDTVTVKNVYANRFGYDGILLDDSTKYVTLDSCKFNQNLRGGISCTGVEHFSASYCEANESGRTAPLSSLSNPGSGTDIEPDLPDSCKYGYFYKCTFNNNLGPAISTNQFVASHVYDMHFDSCTIYSKREIGIFCTGRKYKFENCNIYGAVAWSSVGDNEAEAIKYVGCHFEDKPYQDSIRWEHSKPLISIPGFGDVGKPMKWTHFENCTFRVNDSLREFFYLNWHTAGMAKEDWSVIDNCTFKYNNKGRADTTFCSRLRGVRFINSNKIENILNSTNSYHLFNTYEVMVEGNSTGCNAGNLLFKGQVEHCLMASTFAAVDTFHIGKKLDGTDGFATYEIGDRALTFAEKDCHVKIGNYSAMRALKGGSMLSNNKFYFGGQLTFDAGSYVTFSNTLTQYISTANNPYELLYIDRLCNYNNTSMSPLWTNGEGYATGASIVNFVGSWFGNYGGTSPCIQGNHPQLNNALGCPALYTHIKTHGAKTLLYNMQVPCVGSTADMQFTVQGGVRPFVYKLNGVATDSNLTNIAAGIDTITVTDYLSCTDTFIIQMDTTLTYKIIKGCVSGTPAMFKTNACTQPTVTGPGSISYSNDTVTVTTAGTYTITASGKTATLYIGSCSNCTTAPDTAEWKLPNASAKALFPDGIIPLNNLVLQGTIEIDTILILNNQRDIYCTANAQLTLTDSNTFVCTGTKMRGCTAYWYGIEADGYGKSVIINHSSTMQDMGQGVHIKNNAFLQAKNSKYENNLMAGIQFENIIAPAYRSAISGNTFTVDGATLIPYGNTCMPALSGITIYNSSDIEIGDTLTGKGNTFEKTMAGILIKGNANIQTILNGNSSRIGIYNNKFRDLLDCNIGSGSQKMLIDNCYYSPKGAGVFADYGFVGSGFYPTIDVRNTVVDTSNRFNNCDKALVTINSIVIAENLLIKDCTFGIMNAISDGKPYHIRDNKIEHAVISVQCLGDNMGSLVNSNNITCDAGLVVTPDSIYWPKGIDIRRYIFAPSNDVSIKYNIIDLNSYAGHGIHFISSGSANINDNQISLSYADTTMAYYSMATMLEGIHVSFGKGSSITKNHIIGNNNLEAMSRENIAGITTDNSWDLQIGCNLVSKTRFGIQAISNCQTDSTAVKGNVMHQQVLGWAFRHLGTEGSFTNVGTSSKDNNNTFLNTGLFKVFKFCENGQTYAIYTHPNTLDPIESASYNIITQLNDCKYDVTQNVGAFTTYECPVIYNFQQSSSTNFGHNEAIQIATNTKTYSEYPEIAHWMDAMKLYEQLKTDTSFRNCNDTLLSFYDSLDAEIISQINSTNDRLATLIASMQSQNYELYAQRMDEAINNNSNIVSETVQEANEHDINAIYLKVLLYGKDSLSDEDSIFIETLANQCPYIGGIAVYKARMLYALYNPASMFDDISICNNIGVYKNGGGDGLFDDENNYLKNLKPKQNILANSEHKFVLYPNPASTTITIAYQLQPNEKGNVIVYDLLGREQLKMDLDYNINKVSVNISSLPLGLYTYKYLVNNVQKQAGKLLIE